MSCLTCNGQVGILAETYNAHYCSNCLKKAKLLDETKSKSAITESGGNGGGTPLFIYRILTSEQFAEFQKTKVFAGGEKDIKDGFIHASREDQYMKTYYKIFAGQVIVLIKIDTTKLGESKIKIEADKTGETFPHVYGTIPMQAVAEYSTLCKEKIWEPVPKSVPNVHITTTAISATNTIMSDESTSPPLTSPPTSPLTSPPLASLQAMDHDFEMNAGGKPTLWSEDMANIRTNVSCLNKSESHFSKGFITYFESQKNKNFICSIFLKAIAEEIEKQGCYAQATINTELKLDAESECKTTATTTSQTTKDRRDGLGPTQTIPLDLVCDEEKFICVVKALCHNIPLADLCKYEYNVIISCITWQNFNMDLTILIKRKGLSSVFKLYSR